MQELVVLSIGTVLCFRVGEYVLLPKSLIRLYVMEWITIESLDMVAKTTITIMQK
jgi:hypothetical protein